mgnify:CR=1 FL=1
MQRRIVCGLLGVWVAIGLMPAGIAGETDSPGLPKKHRGVKVLVEFRQWLGGKALTDPNALQKVADEVDEALKKAKVHVVEKIAKAGPLPSNRMFHQLWLLDFGQQDPATILKTIPQSGGAIIFRDGHYHKGLPIPKPQAWEQRHQGKAPLRFGLRVWGAMQRAAKLADLQRFRALKGVNVEYVPPPQGAGGSAGYVILKPEKGTTLLEVFLKSGAGFCYQKPAGR